MNSVLYLVNGELSNLDTCYYCESCNKIINGVETNLEIESYYCPNCLDNIPSSEAFETNFCCSRCFDCPRCSSTLVNIDSSTMINNEVFNKYQTNLVRPFMYCSHCNWSFPNINNSSADIFENLFNLKMDLFQSKSTEDFASKLSTFGQFELDKTKRHIKYIKNRIESRARVEYDTKLKIGLGMTHTTLEMNMDKSLNQEENIRDGHWSISDLENDLIQKSSRCNSKDIWVNTPIIKQHFSCKYLDNYQPSKFNGLSLFQYLKNPQFINLKYMIKNSSICTNLFYNIPCRKHLMVQISKRCNICRRFVTKAQLNPLAQPSYRINLSASLFIPNLSVVYSEKNPIYKDNGITQIVTLQIVNYMDKQIQLNWIPKNSENEEFNDPEISINNIIVDIEPKSIILWSKWDPSIDQLPPDKTQNTFDGSTILTDIRNRNKSEITVKIQHKSKIFENRLSDKKHTEGINFLLHGNTTFQTPTANNVTLEFCVYIDLK
ncbi:uncharacterized protein CMU_013400 [Cryptosporidium muris RN66]|uniref:Dynactin subunit 4 n=1 Tax=Cryptosporidium muris (strain RN66) TaxID=441375 RepID=B6AEP8_CRYMR|nr:uncharacterized protein CMU_013400 [Cryptosporidium muris RN66]EEA06665.1 hypothetical protein, conserved [Cryptosporidium muris RN66]|eukprot:XP_002141014.1 hypothetical protein [Cryptosporidium muris RN66]